jgi:hypothetical protein
MSRLELIDPPPLPITTQSKVSSKLAMKISSRGARPRLVGADL